MSHDTTICVSIHCDRCLAPAAGPEGPPRHWPDLSTAVSDLAGPLGWEASSTRQTCPSCVQAVACQNLGHDWRSWQSMLPLGEPGLAIRLCEWCGQDEVASLDCVGQQLDGGAA